MIREDRRIFLFFSFPRRRRAGNGRSVVFPMLLSADHAGAVEAPVQQTYKTGEVLFEEGLLGKEMYLVQEGKIGVFKNTPKGRVPISVIGTGGILGEQSFFGSHERSATAIAVEPTRVLVFNERNLKHVMETIPPWLYAMLKVIVTNLHDVRARVDQCALRDPERGVVRILLLLLPRHATVTGTKAALDSSLVLQDAECICRLRENEAQAMVDRLLLRGLVTLDSSPATGARRLVVPDRSALELYDEYLTLKARGERFREGAIPEEAVATLSNIAYVAQKSGQETIDGTALYKSALVEDLSDHNTAALLEKSLGELAHLGLIAVLPVEEETLIIFKKERLTRIKKIKEWLPKFEQEPHRS